jgi:hypothetical protein
VVDKVVNREYSDNRGQAKDRKGWMPRKSKQIDGRRKRLDLRLLDKNSKAYWEEVLRREGLTVRAGRNDHRVVYVGTSADLEKVHGLTTAHNGSTGPASSD